MPDISYAITWDKSGERFYEMGVKNGVLYTHAGTSANKTISSNTFKTSYNEGVAWNGLTSISQSPDGAEPNDLWADNMKYASLRSAETFGGTIEAYTYPDEWAVCDGLSTPLPGVQVGQQSRKAFGLCYRTEVGNDVNSEVGYVLHLVWNATASPSERQYETINDSPDAITMSWEFDTTGVNVDIEGYKQTSHIAIDTTRLNAAGKTALETLKSILYGTEEGEGDVGKGWLPDPKDVLVIMGYTEPSGD